MFHVKRLCALAACVALCAPLSAQTLDDVVAAAHRVARPGEAFDQSYVTDAQTDHLPSLEGLTVAQYRRWLATVEESGRMARMVLRQHYGL